MTTYVAKQVIGSNVAANPEGALLQSGAGRADDSATGDTWLFLDTVGGTANPWGIMHSQGDNKVKIFGSGTEGAWVRMNTGDTYLLGKVGIGYDPETSGNTYKLYVNGTSYFNNNVTIADGILYIKKTTTDWKTGARLEFNTTMSDTTGYSYIASYQTPTAQTYNDSLVIVASGGCFIGGGEGAETIHQNVMSGTGTEDLYLCPDGAIRIYTGADNKVQRAIIDSTPTFYPATNNTGNLGSSSYEWGSTYSRVVYARHFDASANYTGDRNMYYGYNRGATHYFYRYDGSTRTLLATLDTSFTVNNGYLKSTCNGNTVTIGSANNGFCHIQNSANIPFWFNKDIQMENGKVIGGAGTQYRPFQLYLGRKSTAGSNSINAANPLIEFSNGDRSQYGQLIYTDYDSVRAPDGLTWVGNQANSWFQAPRVFGAVWNDYAEYRETKDNIQPGRCVVETGHGDLILSTERLQPGCEIVSDTFGFAIGETSTCKTPTACAGRVLAYLYEDKSLAKPGDPVCSGPNGTVSIMTHEEEIEWPSRIIATISEIPDYEEWEYGSADEFGNKEKLKVDGRIWIRVR